MTSMILLLVCLVFQLANGQQRWMPFQSSQQSQFQIPQQRQLGGCYDTAINCLENSYFCNQPYYENTMRQQCARTCNYCQNDNSNFDSNTCRDVNPECRVWASRGFCESLFYPEQVKRRYCALSCRYCRAQSSSQFPSNLPSQFPQDPFDRESSPFDRESRPFDRESRPFDRESRPFDHESRPFDRESRPFDRESRPDQSFDREPRPDLPFADEPTPRHQTPSKKSRKTTTPSTISSEEELVVSTTPEPIENDEKKSKHKEKSKKKSSKNDEEASEK